jgi:hypothetical protein
MRQFWHVNSAVPARNLVSACGALGYDFGHSVRRHLGLFDLDIVAVSRCHRIAGLVAWLKGSPARSLLGAL